MKKPTTRDSSTAPRLPLRRATVKLLDARSLSRVAGATGNCPDTYHNECFDDRTRDQDV